MALDTNPTIASYDAPEKDLYELGEIPPMGYVPKQMYAWAIRRERHGEPDRAFMVETVDVPRPADHADNQKGQRWHDDAQVRHRQFQRLTLGPHQRRQRRHIEPHQRRKNRAKHNAIDQRMRRLQPRLGLIPRAQVPRHQGTRRNRHADAERGGEKQDRPGIPHRRSQFRLAQHRDEDHVDEID